MGEKEKNNIDSFTGLYDKSYLEDDAITGTYVISFDLKKFKIINDTFGHDVGDQAIQLFAHLLKETFLHDVAIHRSGDEFVVISNQSLEQINNSLYQLDFQIKELIETRKIIYPLAFNAGICPFHDSLEVALRNSDLTMFEAKKENQLFKKFENKILEQYQFRENIMESIDVMLSRKSFSYKQISIYDLEDRVKLREYRMVSPIGESSVFQNVALLRERHRIEKIDLQCLEKAVLEIETIPAIVGLDTATVLIEYKKIKNLLEQRTYPIILDININREIRDIELLKKRLQEFVSEQVPICLNGLQMRQASALFLLVHYIPISYVKIDSDVWRQSMTNIRSQSLLKSFMKMCQNLSITPILKEVGTYQEKVYIKSLPGNSYYRK